MTTEDYEIFPCDLCGSEEAEEITAALKYTDKQPLHVCKNCGFVHVKQRRSANRIAEVWSDDIYESDYTARIPAVKARQTYVAEFIDVEVGLKDKRICDIGGGEGQFLEMIKAPEYGANVFAIEPSQKNCDLMTKSGIESFCGSIEDYCDSEMFKERKFDIATIMWTLENCQSCRTMLDAAYDVLDDEGVVAISTGSRLMVPFKKPLHYYLGTNPADSHCFRFSQNTLQGLLAVSGFEMIAVNRAIDTDYLVMIGRKTDKSKPIDWQGDRYQEVVDFFNRWDIETQGYYRGK